MVVALFRSRAALKAEIQGHVAARDFRAGKLRLSTWIARRALANGSSGRTVGI
jgi:hypothetical protein